MTTTAISPLQGTWFTLIDSYGRGWQFCYHPLSTLAYRLANQISGDPDPWTAIHWPNTYGHGDPPRDLRQAQLIAAAWLLEMDRYSAGAPNYTGPDPRLALELRKGERLPGFVEA
jgi:hypothetical protein